jgi:hypothetical protein
VAVAEASECWCLFYLYCIVLLGYRVRRGILVGDCHGDGEAAYESTVAMDVVVVVVVVAM